MEPTPKSICQFWQSSGIFLFKKQKALKKLFFSIIYKKNFNFF